jgi:hypothetical protein
MRLKYGYKTEEIYNLPSTSERENKDGENHNSANFEMFINSFNGLQALGIADTKFFKPQS